MRTRTKRWIAIAVFASVPVASAVELTVLAIRGAPPTDRPPLAAYVAASEACAQALDIYHLNPSVGIAQLQGLLASKATKPADQACAAAELERLEPPSFGRWIIDLANGLLGWASPAFAGARLSLGHNPGAGVAWVIVAVEGIMILVTLRQYTLWRRERLPGPLSVTAISAPTDDPNCTGLGEVIRDRMARAGVPPGTSVPGELAALVVDTVSVAGAEAEKNWLGQALAAIGRALQVTTGFCVNGRAFRTGVDNEACVMLEVKVARTGGTYAVVSGTGSTYEAAAVDASYEAFLALARRPSVATRTPSWLAWTSPEVLRRYQEARTCIEAGSYRGALEHLTVARKEQPGNLLVMLQQGHCYEQIAVGDRDECVLRALEHGEYIQRQRCLESLHALLQAVLCAPDNDDAVAWAAVSLSYSDRLAEAFCSPAAGGAPASGESMKQTRQNLLDLLDSVWRGCGLGDVARSAGRGSVQEYMRRPTEIWADDGAMQVVAGWFRDQAIGLWNWSVKRQRYTRVLRRWWRLAHRLETAGLAHPLSSLRRARRCCCVANLLATEWDRAGAQKGAGVWDAGSRLHRKLLRVRLSLRFVRPALRGTPIYNLAAAEARRAEALKAAAQDPQKAIESAIDYLSRATIGSARRISKASVEGFYADPDFRELVTTEEFGCWRCGFDPEDDDARKVRVWAGLGSHVLEGASASLDAWAVRRIYLAAWLAGHAGHVFWHVTADPVAPISVSEVINWFRHDLALWQCLEQWAVEPSVTSHLLAFDTLRAGIVSPGIALEASPLVATAITTPEGWQALHVPAANALHECTEVLKAVERYAVEHDAKALARDVITLMDQARDRWGRIAHAGLDRVVPVRRP